MTQGDEISWLCLDIAVEGEDDKNKGQSTSERGFMTTSPKLDHHNRQTAERIFRHPTSHNIQWHDVFSLLEAVGEGRETTHGSYEIKVGDKLEILHGPMGRDLTEQHVGDVRKVLRHAGITPETLKEHK